MVICSRDPAPGRDASQKSFPITNITENIQRTLRELSRKCLENAQRTLRKNSENTQRTLREYSENTQRLLKEYPEDTHFTCGAHSRP